MPHPLRIAVLLVTVLTVVWVVATVPDVVPLVAEKATEGGMWTGIAVFIAAAIILGVWPRDARSRRR